ncbi:MAG: potassium transporter, partial [Myxococcales bacterium]|nr:potassium transporter [Myxococcales bacterium]
MNYRMIARLLGALLFFVALSMVVPLGVSILYNDGDALAFVYALAAGVVASAVLYLPFRRSGGQISHLEGFAVVTLTWLLIGFLGALPYIFTGALPSVTDGVFESVSGFTTTGSTVVTEIEALPHGVHMWRAMTQWLGGMGIIVLSVAILPLLGVGGMQL